MEFIQDSNLSISNITIDVMAKPLEVLPYSLTD